VDAAVAAFVRDESHWLFKLSPDEWVRAGLADLQRAEQAYRANNPRGGLVGAKRAAGMALNGVVIVTSDAEPDPRWGRTYVEHLGALGRDATVPARVVEACHELLETALPGPARLVTLRTTSAEQRVLEAARDVIAHAYAIVKRSERKEETGG
jgi:HEPN domain-containing protein